MRLSNKAEKQYLKLPAEMLARAKELLSCLEANPVPYKEYDTKKLKGEAESYRIRLSRFRVLYKVYWELGLVRVGSIERRSDSTYG